MFASFWDFSVKTYGGEGVPEACLNLQNKQGLDVNMLLFCCWYGLIRGRIEPAQLSQVLNDSERWAEQVVRPLRGARSWMKKDALDELALPSDAVMALREKIKSNELAAEKIQQEFLESMVSQQQAREQTAEAQLLAVVGNVKCYFESLNKQVQASDLGDLLKIIVASNDSFSVDEVETAASNFF